MISVVWKLIYQKNNINIPGLPGTGVICDCLDSNLCSLSSYQQNQIIYKQLFQCNVAIVNH